MHPESHYKIASFIPVYAIAHLVTDAACAYLLLGILNLDSNAVLAMLIYNAIAFMFQAPLGWLIDKMLNPKLAAMTGLTFIAVSFLFWNNSYAALIIVSLGNALFHVGGGSLVLSLKEKKATLSAIYVAPGAIGLTIGALLSVSGFAVPPLTFPLLLLILCGVVYFINTPDFSRNPKHHRTTNSNYGILIILLIMIPVAVRSLIGLSIDFPWKQNQHLLILLVAATALGKVVGGILADRYGLMKTGITGLFIATPLLAFYSSAPLLAIFGAFLFNFTMPVTLIATLNILPEQKGLSFGLTTVALFIGSLPTILRNNLWLKSEMMVFLILFSAVIVLYLALHFMIKLKILKR